MGWGPKAPNTEGMNRAAEANAAIAGRAQDLAEKEYADSKARSAVFDPLFQKLINESMASQQQQNERSGQQWQHYLDTFMPAEKRLADAAANYDTAGRRQAAADEAVAGVDAAFDRVGQMQSRELGRRGISMDAGRSATLNAARGFAQAKASAGADTQARKLTEATGLSLTSDVARLGRGIAGTGLQAAQLALSAGGQAGSQLGQQQQTYNMGLAPAQGFMGTAISGNSAAGNIYGNIAGIQQQAANADMMGLGGLGSLAGTLLTAPTTGGGSVLGKIIQSDPKAKTVHGKVSPSKALKKLEGEPVRHWTYKEGIGDGGEHIGRMATKADHEMDDGLRGIDVISELGVHQAAIQELSKRTKRLERKKEEAA